MASVLTTQIDVLERIAEIRDDRYYWGKLPQKLRSALEGNTTPADQVQALELVEPNFRLDVERVEVFASCKDVIPSLGSSEPAWMVRLRQTLHPTARAGDRYELRQAIEELRKAYRVFLRFPFPRGQFRSHSESRECLRENKLSRRLSPALATQIAATERTKREVAHRARQLVRSGPKGGQVLLAAGKNGGKKK